MIRHEDYRKWIDNTPVTYIPTRNGAIPMLGVHPADRCLGRHCIVHHPHRPTKYRNLSWRGDRGFFEEVCPCGIGHPTPEDVEYWRSIDAEYNAIHGCCGEHCYTRGFEDPLL